MINSIRHGRNRNRPYDEISHRVLISYNSHSIHKIEKYQSLGYFEYKTARAYYRNSDFTISRVIVALTLYNEQGYSSEFHRRVDDIVQEGQKSHGLLLFKYKDGFAKFDVTSGYLSGILQAKIASALLRVYHHTRIDNYLELAKAALNACLLSVEEGGPCRSIKGGGKWVEEYPSPTPSMVLNGHIFVLIAFAEYETFGKDDFFQKDYQKLVDSTIAMLPSYKQSEYIFVFNVSLGLLQYALHGRHALSNEAFLCDFQAKYFCHLGR